jgi:uncharacterized protein
MTALPYRRSPAIATAVKQVHEPGPMSLIEFPNFETLAATLHDGRFVPAVAVSVLAGVVRGFSGFGSALIYVPLISAIYYEPRFATVSFVLMDYVCFAPYVVRAIPQCHWREVMPAFVAALVTVPFGTMMQNAVDPVILRWAMAGFVLLFLVLFTFGRRYPIKAGTPAAVCAGAISGFSGGAAQMPGPPAILYWLSTPGVTVTVRANLIVFLAMVGLTLVANYAWHGLMTAKPIALAILLWPVYIVALAVGARWFHGASDRSYRRIAYAIVALAALVSMPIFDRWLH